MSAVDAGYRSPTREEIAARVSGQLPGGVTAVAGEPEPDYQACYAAHLKARLRALSMTPQQLAERLGMNAKTVTAAVNGNSVGLESAARIAREVGSRLPAMLTPYSCATCHGKPPAPFICPECSTQGER